MITSDTLVYTNEGWKKCWDLYVGQQVRSYNPVTNTCVDDIVFSIETDFVATGLMGIKSKSMDQLITQDHPIIIVNIVTKESITKTIGEHFYHTATGNKRILHNRSYNYYITTRDIEEIKWSARICASYAQVDGFFSDQNAILIAKNLGGYESWIWLDTFFHWNVLRSNTTKMGTCFLRNRVVREILLDLAPRAGYGIKFMPYFRNRSVAQKGGSWTIQLDHQQDVIVLRRLGWYLKRYEGNVFNIKTKNGSFLAKRNNGTFLMACDKE
jgi:hypothetical protein